MFRKAIVWLVEFITFNRVRGQHHYDAAPSLRWWWTPWTYHCKHSGWVCLSLSWMRRYWRAETNR